MTRESGRERDEVELKKKKKSSILQMQPKSRRGPVYTADWFGPSLQHPWSLGDLQYWKHNSQEMWGLQPQPVLSNLSFLFPVGWLPTSAFRGHWAPVPGLGSWKLGMLLWETPELNTSCFWGNSGISQKEGVGGNGGRQWKVKTKKQAWKWGLA